MHVQRNLMTLGTPVFALLFSYATPSKTRVFEPCNVNTVHGERNWTKVPNPKSECAQQKEAYVQVSRWIMIMTGVAINNAIDWLCAITILALIGKIFNAQNRRHDNRVGLLLGGGTSTWVLAPVKGNHNGRFLLAFFILLSPVNLPSNGTTH